MTEHPATTPLNPPGDVDRGIRLPGLVNLRDIGGLPLANGGQTRPQRLYRSAAPGALDPAATQWFETSGIDTIVDLRTTYERTNLPTTLGVRRPIQTIHLPLLEGSLQASLSGLPTLPDLYRGMLDDDAAVFAAVARDIAEDRGAVLVHCTAGKDRTGVTVALLLLAVGVPQDAVVADYAETTANLAGRWLQGTLAKVEAAGAVVTDALRTLIAEAPPEALEAAIDHLDTRYGSAVEYLLRNGLSDAEVAALQSSLSV
ncbi:tyrosine-protein phosphatase [Pseudoclavibacter sp. CFCC 14310]|uniref:tyrosine-protein phosphatase n=1 Tax=Pseudoclavibacter sp. CFCC 14310 TaxID=2615180 RepID=UPI0013013501|nr:tyrosine-protein phosphatase [Pseudoclavibacter sp. CFCC 14310]KAB1644631.1 tyrosine-protein phosphatase [Pseudoclavibacter sp. CFCC 14310]